MVYKGGTKSAVGDDLAVNPALVRYSSRRYQ